MVGTPCRRSKTYMNSFGFPQAVVWLWCLNHVGKEEEERQPSCTFSLLMAHKGANGLGVLFIFMTLCVCVVRPLCVTIYHVDLQSDSELDCQSEWLVVLDSHKPEQATPSCQRRFKKTQRAELVLTASEICCAYLPACLPNAGSSENILFPTFFLSVLLVPLNCTDCSCVIVSPTRRYSKPSPLTTSGTLKHFSLVRDKFIAFSDYSNSFRFYCLSRRHLFSSWLPHELFQTSFESNLNGWLPSSRNDWKRCVILTIILDN